MLTSGAVNLSDRKGFFSWTLLIITLPFHSTVLILKEAILDELSKGYDVSLALLKSTKFHVAKCIQIELGLESHLQVLITTVLLLLAHSDTRMVVGFEFLTRNEKLMYLPSNIALSLSTAWSLQSCMKSHIKAISKKRVHSTSKSLITILIFTFVSIVIKVFSHVLFLTPTLGLFSILRHLQGEMYPYETPYRQSEYIADMFYIGKTPPVPWSQITRWTYLGYKEAEPPNPTLYTVFSIGQYFIILGIVFVLNFALQVLFKRLTNPLPFKKLSFMDLIIHGICSCFIPHPMEEWDEEQGTVAMHKVRKKLVLKEVLVSTILNFCINLILLIPIVILGNNHRPRYAHI